MKQTPLGENEQKESKKHIMETTSCCLAHAYPLPLDLVTSFKNAPKKIIKLKNHLSYSKTEILVSYSRHSVIGPSVIGNIQLMDFYLLVN